jgi:four helix bundle protein
VNSYRRLEAWQRCHKLAVAVYRETAAFPKEERYGLTSQARRAAFSAGANIAEGSARRGSREFRRFLEISLGSLAELSYVLDLASDLALLEPDRLSALRDLHTRASQVTWRLYQAHQRATRERT